MRVASAMWLAVVVVLLSCGDLVRADCCGKLSSIGFNSALPVIIIDTWGNAIPDEPKIDGQLCTCAQSGNYDGKIRIEIRGSTSARDFKKKSFALQTSDENGKDLKTDLFGFPADSDWILYGPEMDKSLGLRNILAYALARQTGRYASRTQYCEVFLVTDGAGLNWSHYNGVYVFGEKIKKGESRVNIQKIGDDLSGGFIWKHDNNNIDEGDRHFRLRTSQLDMIMTYPKKKKVTDDQMWALKGFLDNFETQLYARGDYWSLMDTSTFVDYFLLTEITKNPDGYRGSTYMHKDKNGPLRMGPAWDYNEAFGQCCGYPIEGYFNNGESSGKSGGSAISTNGWRFSICLDANRCVVDKQDGVSAWYRILWENEGFRKLVADRWTELRSNAITNGFVLNVIGRARTTVSGSVEGNYKRWGLNSYGEWEAEVNAIQSWTLGRLQWMDSQLLNQVPGFFPHSTQASEGTPMRAEVQLHGSTQSGDSVEAINSLKGGITG